MNDLISRQDTIISLVYADETSCMTCGDLANVVKVLQRISSAEPEIIRCKDCIKCGFCGDNTNLEIMGFNGFCSRAKRKTDE